MKGGLVRELGVHCGNASAHAHIEVLEGSDDGGNHLPAKVISYVLGVIISFIGLATQRGPFRHREGRPSSASFVVTLQG